ncbi:MAG: DUF4199 domain-containing protein [Mameliella sp.]|nr:DUF4199 domain-containing protein [Phaeodactylibacter sp.]NRA49588.1 DUF4199 domain-containing protein [Phaeodactylibacter sp.]
MSTLDHPNESIDPQNVSPWPTGSRHGLLAGLVLIVVGLIIHMTGMVDYSGQNSGGNWVSNITTWGILIAAIFLAVRQHRDQELGGYISFGRSFYVGFIATLLIMVVTTIWGFVFFSFVEPDLIDTMMEMSREQMIEQQGLSESDADQAMGMMGWMMNPVGLSVIGGFATLFTGSIFSLIIGAIMKREA